MGKARIFDAQQDERIAKLNRTARMSKFKVDSTLNKEIKSYIIFGTKTRKAFEPNSAEDLKSLIKDMEKVQDLRDRLTGILLESKALVDELDLLIKSGSTYLYAHWDPEMKACGNKETRDAAIRYVLDPIIRRKEQWQAVIEGATLAKANLTETYFALREIGENGRTILAARNVKRTFDV